MADVQIKLSAIWIALMLTYLLGDVLRIFSGDFKEGAIGGMQVGQKMYLGMAILMVIPIVMVVLSLTLKQPVNRWANIIVGIVFTGIALISAIESLTKQSAYSAYAVLMWLSIIVVTALVVWYAWKSKQKS